MKKIILAILAFFMISFAFPQAVTNDKLYKHNGEIIEVRVTKVDEYAINYKLPNEDLERTIGRLAVEKIEYTNGKTENISDKIVIKEKKDWEMVRIIRNKMEVAGLREGDEIYGKTPYWSVSNISKERIDKKSTQNLKEAAASDYNAPFVLLTSEHENLKKGIVYTYK